MQMILEKNESQSVGIKLICLPFTSHVCRFFKVPLKGQMAEEILLR